jgi:hypothetical protein
MDSPVSSFSQFSSALSQHSVTDWYTVVVGGHEFRLSAAQLATDAPNLFTRCFHGDFAEASTRTLVLDRDPRLFALVADYLRGYEVLPLAPAALPRTMTLETAAVNLARDAEYYGLARLHDLLTAPAILPPHFAAWAGLSDKVVDLTSIFEGRLPEGVLWNTEKGLVDLHGAPILVHARNLALRSVSRLSY